jgi:hypothetical protein
MIIAQEPEAIRHAQSLQAKCELKRVTLRQCHASLEGVQSAMTAPFSLRLSHNTQANAILDGVLRIEVRFQIQSFDKSDPPSLLFSVDCAFDLDYEIEDKAYQPSPESIAAFKDGNAVFNCWPYTRELVQSITTRMGMQPPPIPLLRIVPKQEPKKAEKQEPKPAKAPELATK